MPSALTGAQRSITGGKPLVALAIQDSLLYAVAVPAALATRFLFNVPEALISQLPLLTAGVVVSQLISGLLMGPYRWKRSVGSFEEAIDLCAAGTLTTILVCMWSWPTGTDDFPKSVPLIVGAYGLIAVLVSRFLVRLFSQSSSERTGKERVIVFGAGYGGTRIIQHLKADPNAAMTAVGILDDDHLKSRLRIQDVSVLGTRDDLAKVVSDTGASTLLIAIPSADSSLIRDLSSRANALGLKVLILPDMQQMIRRAVNPDELRSVNVTDLLGRHPVRLDEASIRHRIAGRRVLVTGAGGSIGSELCRQIHRFSPADLVMLDRDESALHAVQLSIYGKALLQHNDVALADIRDVEALKRIFETHRPEVVFHAAALKHLPLLERYPIEAWMTNVVGTLNVLEAAESTGVQHFINISTDKAANPSSILGYSKRVTERLTAEAAARAAGSYVSVRFGNVLGSRGSVLTAFEDQIDNGGPITITHQDVTRFFMTIAEACQLVLQAAALGDDGEALVLDMGDPVRILDVAKTLLAESGKSDVEIVFSGLRPGEKMHEELFGDGEPRDMHLKHPKISHVPVPPLWLNNGRSRSLHRFTSETEMRAWFVSAAQGDEGINLPPSDQTDQTDQRRDHSGDWSDSAKVAAAPSAPTAPAFTAHQRRSS